MKLGSKLGKPPRKSLGGVRCQPMTPADLERLQQKLNQVQSNLKAIGEAAHRLADELGLPSPNNILEVSQVAQLASYIRRCPKGSDRASLAHASWDTDNVKLAQAVANAKSLKEATSEVGDSINDAAWNVDWSQTRIAIAGHGKSWFRIFSSSYRQAVAMLRGVCSGEFPKDADSRVTLIDSIIAIQKANSKLADDSDLAGQMLGTAWKGTDSEFSLLDSILAWAKEAEKNTFTKANGRHIAAKIASLEVLAEPLAGIAKLLKTVDGQLSELVATLKLDTAVALDAKDARSASFSKWIHRITSWFRETMPKMTGAKR